MTALYTKPTTMPRWADTSTNILEPPDAKKNEGWLFDEIPPSSYDNWREKSVGDWFKWINERFFDGATKNALFIKSPGSATTILEISDYGLKNNSAMYLTDNTFIAGIIYDVPFILFDTGEGLTYSRSANILNCSTTLAIGTGLLQFGTPTDLNQLRFNTSGSKFTLEIAGIVQYTFDTISANFGNKNITTTANLQGKSLTVPFSAVPFPTLGAVVYTGEVVATADPSVFYIGLWNGTTKTYLKSKTTTGW